MSPLELPGKSFGYLPDRRNVTCDNCGRSFDKFLVEQGQIDIKKGMVRLKCPFCSYQLKIIEISKVEIKVEKKEVKKEKSKKAKKGGKKNKK